MMGLYSLHWTQCHRWHWITNLRSMETVMIDTWTHLSYCCRFLQTLLTPNFIQKNNSKFMRELIFDHKKTYIIITIRSIVRLCNLYSIKKVSNKIITRKARQDFMRCLSRAVFPAPAPVCKPGYILKYSSQCCKKTSIVPFNRRWANGSSHLIISLTSRRPSSCFMKGITPPINNHACFNS